MNYKGHLLFGVIFLIILAIVDKMYFHFFFTSIDLKFWLVFSPIILFSFLLPDIDHRISMPHLIVSVLLIAIILYSAFTGNMTYVIAFSIVLLFVFIMNFIPGWAHRGHAHSLIFVVLISLLVIFISWKLAIIFALGGLSHLIADACIKIW